MDVFYHGHFHFMVWINIMTGRTHLILGLAVGILIAPTPAGAALGAVGGLLCDIDHPKSLISGYIPGIGLFLKLGRIGHRTITHSVLFVATTALLAYLGCIHFQLPIMYVSVFAAAVGSHLLADMTTPWGVPLMLPLTGIKFRLLPRGVLWLTSGIIETVVFLGCIVAIGWRLYPLLMYRI
jgi:inner membrane protein